MSGNQFQTFAVWLGFIESIVQRRHQMHLKLTVEANDFVKSLVAQGKYQSAEDAIIDGIRLLKCREVVREKIALGLSQLDRGESIEEESVFHEVGAEISRVESLGNQG